MVDWQKDREVVKLAVTEEDPVVLCDTLRVMEGVPLWLLNSVLLSDTVPQLVEATLGLCDVDCELDRVEVWHPETDTELEVLRDSVMQLDTVTE